MAVEYTAVSCPIRFGKCSLTSDGSKTFAVATPARTGTVQAMKTSAEWTVARHARPTAVTASDPIIILWTPTFRAHHGPTRPKTAKQSTGRVVRIPAVVELIPSDASMSPRTGATLTAAGRRLRAKTTSPTAMRICWRRWLGTVGHSPLPGPGLSSAGARTASTAAATGAEAAHPVRQTWPAALHQPPRLRASLRAGGTASRPADRVLVGVQPPPADLLRERLAHGCRERSGVPGDRGDHPVRPRRRPRRPWTARFQPAWTSSMSLSPAMVLSSDRLQAGQWRVAMPGVTVSRGEISASLDSLPRRRSR